MYGQRVRLQRGSFLRGKRHVVLAIADFLTGVASYIAVYMVRTIDVPHALDERGMGFILGAALCLVAALFIFGGYNRAWSRTSGHDVTVLLSAVFQATIVLALVDWLLRPRPIPLSVVLVGNAMAFMGFTFIRYRSRLITGLIWRWNVVWHTKYPKPDTRVLIVGAGDAGQTTAWRLKYRPRNRSQKYAVVGFVDDDPDKQGLYVEGAPVLGARQDIPTLVTNHAIDLVLLAENNISGPDFREILEYCQKSPAQIKRIPDVFEWLQPRQGTLLREITPEDLLGRQTVSWHEAVDRSPIRNKTILITGAAGSIGSELCRQLLAQTPTKLILLDNNESELHDLYVDFQMRVEADSELIPVLADITNRNALREVFEAYRPQVLFHSAAFKHVPLLQQFPAEAIRVNIGGTFEVASQAVEHQVERFVLISTDKAVQPCSVMGATKRICELIVQAMAQRSDGQTLFTAVRFGNVLGSRGSVVPIFKRQIERGGPVTVTHPEMCRYFMTIPEAANLVIHAACLTQGGDLFMLQMGEEVSILDLAKRMIRLYGLRPHEDIPIEITGMREGEKLHEVLYSESEQPRPTAHPAIVELVSSECEIPTELWLANVQHLLDDKANLGDAPFERLQEVIACAEYEGSGNGSRR